MKIPKSAIKTKTLKQQSKEVEKLAKWLENQTQKVIEKLPKLKKNLTIYDDKSDELYNLESESIQLITKSYIADIESGSADKKSLEDYILQLETYGNEPIENLVKSATQKRLDSFIDNLLYNVDNEEVEYVQSILDKMSTQQKISFTRSKLFWNIADYSSESIREFMDMYGISIATANLENFAEQHGIRTDRLYYTENITNTHQGRNKKK